MNILILGTFVNGSLENYYSSGLMKQGHNVLEYEINRVYYEKISKNFTNKVLNRINPNVFFYSINRQLIEFISNMKFDVIIVFKGLTLFPETISVLKGYCKFILNYNPDHPLEYFSSGAGNNNIYKSLKLYDLVITYSHNIKNRLINDFSILSSVIPFGFSLHKENAISLNQRRHIKFIGSYDRERHELLDCVENDDLQIFGDDKWKKFDLNKSYKSFQNEKIYQDRFISEVQKSKAVINVLRKQNIVESSHNMRTFEIPALGGVLITDFTDEQASFFEPGKEMLFYSGKEELKSVLEYLRQNPSKIEAISKKAYERSIKSNYSYDHRSLELVKIINYHIK